MPRLPVHQTRSGRPVRHSMPWHRSIGITSRVNPTTATFVPEQREFRLKHPRASRDVACTGFNFFECGFGCGVGRFRRVNALEGNASLTLFNAGFFSVRNGRHSWTLLQRNTCRHAWVCPAISPVAVHGQCDVRCASATTIDLTLLTCTCCITAPSVRECSAQWEIASALPRASSACRGFTIWPSKKTGGAVTDATDWSWTVQGGGRIVSSGLNAIYQAQAAGQLDSPAQHFHNG